MKEWRLREVEKEGEKKEKRQKLERLRQQRRGGGAGRGDELR